MLMLIELLILMIDDPLVVIVFFWAIILFHDLQRSNTLSLILQLNLNRELQLWQLQRSFGLRICFKSSRSPKVRHLLYTVITRVLLPWPVIQNIILEQNILSQIFILFMNTLYSNNFKSFIFLTLISVLTFSPNPSSLISLLIFKASLMSFPYLKLEGGC